MLGFSKRPRKIGGFRPSVVAASSQFRGVGYQYDLSDLAELSPSQNHGAELVIYARLMRNEPNRHSHGMI